MSDEIPSPPPPPAAGYAQPPAAAAFPQTSYGQTSYNQAAYNQAAYNQAPYPPSATTQPPAFGGYAYPPAKRRSPWFYVAVIGGSAAAIALVFGLFVWAAMHSVNGTDGAFATNQIAVVEVTGVILDAEKVDSQIRRFADDASVKAIILHINSPGGGAAASQEIYHEVLRLRQEKHKRIVASVESVGASGAYYIASACDRIYANDASVVGSIGVIMEWTNYGDLLRWAKLKNITIHAGELKDAGDPSRDLTPKEQAYFQSLVDNMYAQFVHDVAVGRHTTDDRIRPLATGQVWTGQQSLPLGLIDQVGGFRIALTDTARAVGISGEPSIVRPASQKRGLLSMLTSDGEDLFPNPSQLLNRAPGFYFMWR